MLTDGKLLDLLYRQTAPEKILDILKKNLEGEAASFLCPKDPLGKPGDFLELSNQPVTDKRHFLDYAETTLQGYSQDEHTLLYEQLGQHRIYWKEKGLDLSCGFLIPLIEFAEKHLMIRGGEPVCRQGKVLDWREAYLCLGQDIFVAALFAWEDFRNDTVRMDFSWPVILHADHQDLYGMLRKGLAENHNHLAGGTQSYQVTWCRMMNYPSMIRKELKNFYGSNLYSRMHRGEKLAKLDKFDELELAAVIRTILFRALHRDRFANNMHGACGRVQNTGACRCSNGQKALSPEDLSDLFDGRTAFEREYVHSFCMINDLEETVDVLRNSCGVRVNTLDAADYCLDYALEDRYLRAGRNRYVRILVGERSFLYRCIQACLRPGVFSEYEKELFYLYIVLQANFRSEMIQNNGQTGFVNFKNYQDRKDDAWDETPYFSDAMSLGLNNRLDYEHVTSLEGRMVPKAQVEKNINKVFRSDLAKRFADCRPEEVWDVKNYSFHPDLDTELFRNAEWFYAFHYFKIPDDRKLDPGAFELPPCRHSKHRKLVKDQTRGFVRALRESPYFRCRVRAIDAASEEVFCRPEIFAVGFRYIDAVQQTWNVSNDGLFQSSPIRISKTYHAGEDFMDIAGGLRAIDEAIRFLHMEPFSRIGHALALGVEPEVHYRTKHYEIVTTRQDRLDDLVWILYRGKELGVTIEPSLEAELRQEAEQLFREIYLEALRDNHWDSNLSTYWKSMKLREDDPSVYSTGAYVDSGMDGDELTAYLADRNNRELESYRKDLQITGLYYHYHFDIQAGLRGKCTYTKEVSRRYIVLMRRIQEAMMEFLNSRGIIIETNPSSNVLIGTFKDYCLHPVFRFNDRKLYGDRTDKGNKRIQMNVCVNTDDLGVFDTNLEFEYALLYEALQKRREYADVEGHSQIQGSGHGESMLSGYDLMGSAGNSDVSYSDFDILEYLDDLREMGVRAVFPSNISE